MAAKKIIKRILSKKVPVEPSKVGIVRPELVPEIILQLDKQGCVECGEPLAEGQTYVCKSHIRRG